VPSSTSQAASTAAPTTASATPGAVAQSPVPAENNPPGDIPDNVAFVPYRNAQGRYAFTHPEGWAETSHGSTVLFTDKLNGVEAVLGTATAPPTVATAKRDDVPRLKADQPAFELRGVSAVTLPAGGGVRIVYRRNSVPDPVTGRQYRDEVQRYEIVSHGREVVLELFGPVGADNVDAYRTMSQSLRIT
jgi:hypothetical protein